MPINPEAYLKRNLFHEGLAMAATRDGFGEGLVLAGEMEPNLVVLCADLTESTRTLGFKDRFPERFIQVGVSEQSLAAIAAGLALAGKIPFITSYACFSPGRNWEQIRTTACLQKVNVKIAGAHAGVTVGPDGATHQMTEDLALMRVLPNMTVLVPCDSVETSKAVLAAVKHPGPVYLRFGREKTPVFTTAKTPFQIGRASVFNNGADLLIVAIGPLLHEALMASERLLEKGIKASVLNAVSLKPFDEEGFLALAKNCGAVVTAEEAQAVGGLGGLVAELLGQYAPMPLERVGLEDVFGQSGTPRELLEFYKLTAPHIARAGERAVKRKLLAKKLKK
ncbi:MAG: transketolase C-terminal domain-containing protein [Patescibacteria group bacterium]|mgnify:FL=1